MIEPLAKADLPRIACLQPQGWQDIVTYFRFYLASPFCHPLKIESRERVVVLGSVILHEDSAWLAHIIVDQDMRRKGLGLAMTEALIALAERNGRGKQLLIATAMGRPLYERLGFRFSCEYLAYAQHDPADFKPAPLARPMEAPDLPAILELDREASGEGRSGLLSGHAVGGWLIGGGGNKPRGCYLPNMDEGLIVARDADAGLALLQTRLATHGRPATLPAGNEAANAQLRGHGLNVERRLARMVRGGDDPLRQHMLFNRIGGHVG